MNKKTLVIHPDDRSTDFLSKIYEGKEDWDIERRHANTFPIENFSLLTKSKTNAYFDTLSTYERIILLGHGSPQGLFHSYFYNISASCLNKIKDIEFITIFCNSDRFVATNKLNASFYTGMFISEVAEASYYNIKTDQRKIDYSNNLFALVVNKAIDMKNANKRLEHIKFNYNSNFDPVIQFNNLRLYSNYEEENEKDTDIFTKKTLQDILKYMDENNLSIIELDYTGKIIEKENKKPFFKGKGTNNINLSYKEILKLIEWFDDYYEDFDKKSNNFFNIFHGGFNDFNTFAD